MYETEVALSLGMVDDTNDLRSSCVMTQPDRIIECEKARLFEYSFQNYKEI
jgi:hypothetical protein